MANVMVIAGFGPGISASVADRFGREGFRLALIARNAPRLAEAVKDFAAKEIRADAFVADLSDPAAARKIMGTIREKCGPISVLHWNVPTEEGGDLTTADGPSLRVLFDVAVSSLLGAVQAALPDLRSQKGTILVTNGGLGLFDPAADELAVASGSMGLAVANAAKHKLVGLLSTRLRSEEIYVGEVMVLQAVKGTPADNGTATLEAATVADRFWQCYQNRNQVTVNVS